MTFLADLQKLVECQSPTEDLAACQKVMEVAKKIAEDNLPHEAEIVIESGRPVFGGVLRILK